VATPEQAVALAQEAVADHLPYVWGGISLTGGADCSGELVGILEALGIDPLARTSEAQFAAWPVAPGPGLGIAVFFYVNSDGPASEQPGHVALCLSATEMEEEPHTGLDAQDVEIPNIPGVESIMGYRYLPGIDYSAASTPPPPPPPGPPPGAPPPPPPPRGPTTRRENQGPDPPAAPVVAGLPVPPPLALLTGEITMALSELDIQIAYVHWAFDNWVGRPLEPNSPAEKTWVGVLQGQGPAALQEQLQATPEGQSLIAGRRKAFDMAPAPAA